jgi:hypothetical protein
LVFPLALPEEPRAFAHHLALRQRPDAMPVSMKRSTCSVRFYVAGWRDGDPRHAPTVPLTARFRVVGQRLFPCPGGGRRTRRDRSGAGLRREIDGGHWHSLPSYPRDTRYTATSAIKLGSVRTFLLPARK